MSTAGALASASVGAAVTARLPALRAAAAYSTPLSGQPASTYAPPATSVTVAVAVAATAVAACPPPAPPRAPLHAAASSSPTLRAAASQRSSSSRRAPSTACDASRAPSSAPAAGLRHGRAQLPLCTDHPLAN